MLHSLNLGAGISRYRDFCDNVKISPLYGRNDGQRRVRLLWLHCREGTIRSVNFFIVVIYVCLPDRARYAVHSYYYNNTLSSEFFTLVQNLEEMSRRWRGQLAHAEGSTSSRLDLAGQYASQLRGYHARCQKEPEFADHILSYSGADVLLRGDRDALATQGASNLPSGDGPWSHVRAGSRVTRSEREETVTPMHFPRPDSSSAISSPLAPQRPASTNAPMGNPTSTMDLNSFRPVNYSTPSQDNLMMMSTMLLDQNFADLDRVITHNGADFSFYGLNEFYNYNNP